MRILSILLALTTFSCASAQSPAAPSKPRNVILVIGDGMGAAHFTAARLLRGADYRIGTMPVAGLVSTHALNSIAPDSASSASSYATGAKANYRAISVDASGKPLETALEIAERTGRATGLVTTANFYDATPAAFAAHAASRTETDLIISQMLKSGAEIIVGGGAAKFTDDAVATANGFTVARTGPALFSTEAPHVLGVFTTQKNEMEFPDAPLLQIARWAIDRLSRDPDGFFLLLEHEGTDGASHANATEDFITAVKALDAMAGIALDFAARNPDTLVIVTGDHETGGLQILPENKQELELRWGGKGHTAEMLPIFARGPGAERFSGAMDNDEVGRRLKQLLSLN